MATALTREQKLLAEIVVQLGNITEAIQSAAAGEDSSDLNNKIDALQSQLAAVSSARAALQQHWLKRKPSMLNFNLNWHVFTKVTLRQTTLQRSWKPLELNTTDDTLRQIDGAKAQMDTSEAYCWYLQGRRRGDNPPCSCLATYGTTCGRFY